MNVEDTARKMDAGYGYIRSNVAISDVFIYAMFSAGLFGLGLMNWAELRFDITRISIPYLVSFSLQLFSYGAIILSMSVQQLDKRKKTHEELFKNMIYIEQVLENYRPEKLDEYVHTYNDKKRKEAFVAKYQNKLVSLSEKKKKEELERSWYDYQKLKKEDGSVEPPNKYCRQKEEYLDKINNWEAYYLKENIKYDKLNTSDLTVDVSRDGRERIPRETEGAVMFTGVMRSLAFMAVGGIITTLLLVGIGDGGIDAIIKTFITVFFVFLSVFKGLTNGERTYERTTLLKAKFRKYHLHAYSMFEATYNDFLVVQDE